MEIRELRTEAARREAVPILRQLWTDRDPSAVLEWTGAEDYHCLGGFADGELLAVAGVLESTHLHHRRVAWLYDLVVDEPHRGEGYGAALVAAVEDWAAERDLGAVALASPLAKDDTHAFYEAAGYERWGYVIEKRL
jgi:GNAT superfamily N-acetyltransferase